MITPWRPIEIGQIPSSFEVGIFMPNFAPDPVGLQINIKVGGYFFCERRVHSIA